MSHLSLKKTGLVLLFSSLLMPSLASAYDFAVMPVRSQAKTEQLYQPMMEYLTKTTGVPIKLKTYKNFVDYWQDMRDGKFELSLCAAHFIDYRVINHEHQVLVKLKDKVSFSLVTTADDAVLEASDLNGKPIACLAAPSRGNLQIDTFFKNPLRQPRKTEVSSYEDAVVLMEKGTVKAAILPTPMVKMFTDLYVVESTELWPHMGVTASPKVPTKVKAAVAKALLYMPRNEEGKAALAASGLVAFRPADNSVYEGYSRILSSYTRYSR